MYALLFICPLQLKLKKRIVKSLPTRDEKCNPMNYQACVMKAFNDNIKKNYNCSLAILPNNGAKSRCSNSVSVKELKVQIIPTCYMFIVSTTNFFIPIINMMFSFDVQVLKIVVELDKYMNCVNIKPCNRVVYSLINPSRIPEPPPKPGQPHMHQLANLAIQFENTEVGNI